MKIKPGRRISAPALVATLWVSGRLGPLEELCLTSFVRNGHPVALYTYEGVDNAPAGVELRDGEEVLPFATMRANRYANGSWALGSNLFRYELQRLGKGLWVDTDVVSIRPFPLADPVVVGWESPDYLNGAILYLQQDLPVIGEAIAAFHAGRVPSWVNWHQGLVPRLKSALGMRLAAPDMPHGTFGPKGVTALLRRHQLMAHARPPEVFYPLSPKRALGAFDGSLTLDEVITEESLTLHLWNEKLGDIKRLPWPKNALISELARRYA